MPDEAPAASAPALGFSITATINQKRQIVFQSFLPLDAEPKAISDIIDKAMNEVDRQENKYVVRDLKLVLENDERSLKQHIEQVANLQNAYAAEHNARGLRGEFELKGQQKTNVENTRKTIDGLRERVDRIKTQIAELSA